MTFQAPTDPHTLAQPVQPSADPEVIVFNLKKRYTGVSATVNALVPLQLQQHKLAYCGTPLPNGVPGLTLKQAIRVSKVPPAGKRFRIWHVRRDHEMMAGIWARDVLRLPIKLVFTSAAKRQHGWFPRWLISRMDAVICTSDSAARFVPNSTAVVPHGVSLQRFTPPANKLQAWTDRTHDDWGAWQHLPGRYGVGLFGRIRPEKGTHVFVQAMIQALPHLPEVTAVMAGLTQPQHQAYRQELQDHINAAGLQDRIVFLGEVPASHIQQWYQRCLVTVACPRYEAFGLTAFEAAACGCALVCTRTGAFEDLVQPGVNGQLVNAEDPAALAQALLQVMQSPEHALALGQAALTRVGQGFSLEHEAAGIAQVYEGLFNQG